MNHSYVTNDLKHDLAYKLQYSGKNINSSVFQ